MEIFENDTPLEALFDPVDSNLYDYRFITTLLADHVGDADTYDPEDVDFVSPAPPDELLSARGQVEEAVKEVNHLNGWDGNFISGYKAKDRIREKVESLRVAVKPYRGALALVATLAAYTPLHENELDKVTMYLRDQFVEGWGRVLNQEEIETESGPVRLVAWRDNESMMQTFCCAKADEERLPAVTPDRADEGVYALLGKAKEAIEHAAAKKIEEMWQDVFNCDNREDALQALQQYVKLNEPPEKEPPHKKGEGKER